MNSMIKGSLLLFAATLIGCQSNSNQYTINGSAGHLAEGDTLYLADENLTPIDTAIVSQGKFTFTGTEEAVKHLYLTDPSQRKLIDFFVEKGTIALSLTSDTQSATGTEHNDLYQPLRVQADQLANEYATMRKQLFSIDYYEIFQELDAKVNEKVKELCQLIEPHLGTIAGTTLLNKHKFVIMRHNDYKQDAYKVMRPLLDKVPEALKAEVQSIEEAVAKLESIEVGKKFTDIAMTDPQGQTVKLSDYAGKGKVVLVDFWASWCGPCIQSIPALKGIYQKHHNKGFEIVGISLDNNQEAWTKAIEKHQLTWPHMSDLKGWNSIGATTYSIRYIPQTILLDAEGTIIGKSLSEEELDAKLNELLK